jgi:hypothetical protein
LLLGALAKSSDVPSEASNIAGAMLEIVAVRINDAIMDRRQPSHNDQIRGKCVYKKGTCNGGSVILSDKNGIKNSYTLIGDSSFVFSNLDSYVTYELNIKYKNKYSKKIPINTGENLSVTIEE